MWKVDCANGVHLIGANWRRTLRIYSLTGICLSGYVLLVNTFAALAEPNRREILDLLRLEPRTVSEVVDSIGLSQPAVSKHLRVLRDVGLVKVRPEGQRRWYEVDPTALLQIEIWLEPYRQLWSYRFDALETHLNNSTASNTPDRGEQQ